VPAPKQIPPAGALGLWAFFSLAMTLIGVWLELGGHRFAVALAVLLFLFAGQIFFAAADVRERIAKLLGPADAVILPAVLLAAYIVYAVGAAGFSWKLLALAFAYVVAPAAVALWAGERPAGAWHDYLLVCLFWLPVEFRLVYRLWPYPSAANHALTILFAVNVAIMAFLFLRELDGVGYTIAWGSGFGIQILAHYAIFAAFAIPVGIGIHFIRFAPTLARLKSLPIAALGNLLFTAWPEELLFRGLLQNLLSRTLRSPVAGLLVASVVFGLAHLNNGPFPDWRYVFLATVAGLFYGRVWQKTGSLTASAIVHSMVDVTWHALFASFWQ
jgi:membrane protease YdiL (CAAX protease family)